MRAYDASTVARLWRWLPPLGWMAVIYFLSTDYFSAPELRRTLTGFFLAKSAHLIEYALLAFLWYRGINGKLGSWNRTAAILSVVASSTYAIVDEFHQSFTVSRNGNANDVFIDSCGALLSILVLWTVIRVGGLFGGPPRQRVGTCDEKA